MNSIAARINRALPEALIIDAVRTPVGRYRGALSGCGPTTSPPASSTPRSSAPGSTRAGSRHLHGRRQPGRRGQPRRRAHGGAARRASRSRCPGHRQPPLRLRPRGRQPGLAGAPPRRGRPLPRRRHRVDEPRPVGRAEARAPPCRAAPQTMHDTALGWRLVNPKMEELHSTEAMGETAENVAERYGISREDSDAFALRSHERAVDAQRSGRFTDEMISVATPGAEGRRDSASSTATRARARTRPREAGEAPRPPSARTASSPPATPRPSTTAPPASSSPPRRRPTSSAPSRSAAILGIGVAGVDPAVMGIGPVQAIPRALEHAGLCARPDRPDRDQRGLRLPGPRLRPRARHRRGAAQRQRRRDRARPPARLLRRPHPDHAALGDAPPRRPLRDRGAMRRRRPGRRDRGREPGRELISSSSRAAGAGRA